jgi:hypothetical protein
MPRDRLKRDLTVTLRTVMATRFPTRRVEIGPTGKIAIVPGEPEPDPDLMPEAADADTDPETLAIDEAVRNAEI